MVCLVEEETTGRLVPSCATPVQDGQRILTASMRARDARLHAVELLLAEHAGDCEAPCTRVCPARLDVPSIIRRIAKGDRRGAALCRSAGGAHPGPACDTCSAPCERACRRARVDRALNIRALLIGLGPCDPLPRPGARDVSARHDSRCGHAETATLRALAAAADARASRRRRNAADADAAEAGRCLECDCVRKASCLLRSLAEEIGADTRRLGLRRPALPPPPQTGGGVSFSPGKCIRCGICVRISDRAGARPGIAFSGRSSTVEVRGALGADFASALGTSAAECISRCPTGALARQP
jgi:predicted molibdopterin-dependent oxidoreductase YjgC